jgi:hypothetical protein
MGRTTRGFVRGEVGGGSVTSRMYSQVARSVLILSVAKNNGVVVGRFARQSNCTHNVVDTIFGTAKMTQTWRCVDQRVRTCLYFGETIKSPTSGDTLELVLAWEQSRAELQSHSQNT